MFLARIANSLGPRVAATAASRGPTAVAVATGISSFPSFVRQMSSTSTMISALALQKTPSLASTRGVRYLLSKGPLSRATAVSYLGGDGFQLSSPPVMTNEALEKWGLSEVVNEADALVFDREDWAFYASRNNETAFNLLKENADSKAEALLHETMRVVRESPSGSDRDLVDTYLALYVVHMRRGEYTTALEYAVKREEEIKNILNDLSTPDPQANVAAVIGQLIAFTRNYLNMAYAHREMGNYDKALELSQMGEQVSHEWGAKLQTYGDYRTLDEALMMQYDIVMDLGRIEDGEKLLRKVIAHRERRHGCDSAPVTIITEELAHNLELQNRMLEAEMAYRRCIDLRMREPRHPVESLAAVATTKLAKLYGKTGRIRDGRTQFRKALKMRETFYGTPHPVVIETLEEYLEFAREALGANPENSIITQEEIIKVEKRIAHLKSVHMRKKEQEQKAMAAAASASKKKKKTKKMTAPAPVTDEADFDDIEVPTVGMSY